MSIHDDIVMPAPADLKDWTGPRIQITRLGQPEGEGCVMIRQCPLCRVTEILYNTYGKKPPEADGYLLKLPCTQHLRMPRVEGFGVAVRGPLDL